ncbi:MAG: hypothetical protein WBD00_05005 [Candidatus Omnitrophota bacterium]
MSITGMIKSRIREFKAQTLTDKVYEIVVLLWVLVCTVGAVSHFLYYLNLCRSSYEIYVGGRVGITMFMITVETLIAWVFMVIVPIKIVPVIRFICVKVVGYIKGTPD